MSELAKGIVWIGFLFLLLFGIVYIGMRRGVEVQVGTTAGALMVRVKGEVVIYPGTDSTVYLEAGRKYVGEYLWVKK